MSFYVVNTTSTYHFGTRKQDTLLCVAIIKKTKNGTEGSSFT